MPCGLRFGPSAGSGSSPQSATKTKKNRQGNPVPRDLAHHMTSKAWRDSTIAHEQTLESRDAQATDRSAAEWIGPQAPQDVRSRERSVSAGAKRAPVLGSLRRRHVLRRTSNKAGATRRINACAKNSLSTHTHAMQTNYVSTRKTPMELFAAVLQPVSTVTRTKSTNPCDLATAAAAGRAANTTLRKRSHTTPSS